MTVGLQQAWSDYRRLAARRAAILAAGFILLVILLVADVMTGPALLSPGAVARAFLRIEPDPVVDTIVFSLRLPAAFMAIAVGIGLALSGAIMQTILNNPMASSYTLGVSAGAGFGAALVIVLGRFLPVPELYAIPAAAFAFAGVACGGVYGIGRARGATPETLVLAGIALMFLFQAMLSLMQFVASPEVLQQLIFWLFGSLHRSSWTNLAIVAVAIAACLPPLASDTWRLTALRLGDERARALGIDVATLRLRAFIFISITTGVAVAFVGTIGFIGLVAPHVARMMVGEDQRFLLPASAVAGACLLSGASVVSKLILPGALFPVGIVTSLIGVPFFVFLILRTRRIYW